MSRPLIYYGLCRGGPFNRKHLAHVGEGEYRIVFDELNKVVIGYQGDLPPGFTEGFYRHNADLNCWDWCETHVETA